MNDAQTGSRLRRGWLRLLDGERAWGSLHVQPDRFGVTRYRLVVFPPGISHPERRRLRLAGTWPVWAALAWVFCEIWLTNVTGPCVAVVISTAVFVGVGMIMIAMAGAPRTQVRTLSAAVSATFHNPEADAARDRLGRLAMTLIEADDRLESGRISPTDHELRWWRVYDEIGEDRAA